MLSFLEKIIIETVRMTDEQLSLEKKKELVSYENSLLEQARLIIEDPCSSLEEIQERLAEEFGGRKQCRKLSFDLPQEELENGYRYSYEALYMAIWILLRKYWDFHNKNEAKVRITLEEKNRLGAEITISRSKNILEEKLCVAESAVRGIVESCERTDRKEEIFYCMKIKSMGE